MFCWIQNLSSPVAIDRISCFKVRRCNNCTDQRFKAPFPSSIFVINCSWCHCMVVTCRGSRHLVLVINTNDWLNTDMFHVVVIHLVRLDSWNKMKMSNWPDPSHGSTCRTVPGETCAVHQTGVFARTVVGVARQCIASCCSHSTHGSSCNHTTFTVINLFTCISYKWWPTNVH